MISPFFILPWNLAKKLEKNFRGITRLILKILPSITFEIRKIGEDVDPKVYVFNTLLSSFIISIFATLLILVAIPASEVKVLLLSLTFIGSNIVFVALNLLWPRLLKGGQTSELDKELSFAIRDLLVQIKGGVPIYDAIVALSVSDYKVLSQVFKKIVDLINAGYGEAQALQKVAVESDSEFMKRVLWQLSNAMERGGNLSTLLGSLTEYIERYNERVVKGYISLMNIMVLMFFLVAVTLPSLGIVFLVVLSSVGGFSLDVPTLLTLVGGSVGVQFFMLLIMSHLKPAILR